MAKIIRLSCSYLGPPGRVAKWYVCVWPTHLVLGALRGNSNASNAVVLPAFAALCVAAPGKMTNTNIVPRSPYLLLWRGGAHINVEVCASSTSRVYLAKYLIKAPAAALPASPSLAPLAAPAAPAANGLHRAC